MSPLHTSIAFRLLTKSRGWQVALAGASPSPAAAKTTDTQVLVWSLHCTRAAADAERGELAVRLHEQVDATLAAMLAQSGIS
eukprot:2074345-Rhodomonas_salina.1